MLEIKNEYRQDISPELYRNKNSIVNDAYDRLVAGIHLFKKKEGYSTFTITGCKPEAGATTIAISLSISMAASGHRTLLIDTDMRKRSNHKRLNQKIDTGLSDYLAGTATLSDITCSTNIDNLYYIACGGARTNKVELLCSDKFEALLTSLKDSFDAVVFDSPSLNAVVDASIIASKTDSVILVAEQFKTTISQIKAAKRELDNVGANLLGVILNKVNRSEYKRYLKHYDYFQISRGK
jgi:capsular exopolysaccharide synthesis family protein